MAEKETTTDCGICGTAFTYIQATKKRKYCTECKGKPKYILLPAAELTCAGCGKAYTPKRKNPRGKWCSIDCMNTAPKPYIPDYTCNYCGEIFKPKARDRTKYCSWSCSAKKRSDDRRPITEEIKAIRRIAKNNAPPRKKEMHVSACEYCKTDYERNRANQIFCSRRCGINHRLDMRTRSVSTTNCTECGVLFSRVFPHRSRTTCSDDCAKARERSLKETVNSRRSKRIMAARTSAKIRGCTTRRESIDPYDVFHRDGWKCVACGDETPKELRGSIEDNAPELDHVIPISRGGEHTYSNLQTLCRLCNLLKSDMPMHQYIAEYVGGVCQN
jgi:5-methylcytosine-specific restriction endonuclease McrA